jgi:hypothetical protein
VNNFLQLGVELELEVSNDPSPRTTYESSYTIYGSYPKHTPMGKIHTKHGNIIKAADKASGGKVETHYDNTINDGFEWVGKPMTFEENVEVWSAMLTHSQIAPYIHADDVKETEGNGYGTHDVGMHVHVSGKQITPEVLGKIIVFINKKENLEFIQLIANRKLNRFCETQPTLKVEDGLMYYHSEDCVVVAKRNHKFTYTSEGQWDLVSNTSIGSYGYCCKNAQKLAKKPPKRGAVWVTPANKTGDFEVRIFKSTTKVSRFTTNLMFVVALVDFCVETSPSDLLSTSFGSWMGKLENRIKYTDLFKLMRSSGYTGGLIPSVESLNRMIANGKFDKSRLIGNAA